MNNIQRGKTLLCPETLSAEQVLSWQQDQYSHDERNHRDILNFSKHGRLKHYAAHFAKYVGRLVNPSEIIPNDRTAIDILLVSLSAANTIHQILKVDVTTITSNNVLTQYSIAQADFNNGTEKIDHLELRGTADLLENSNQAIFNLSLAFCNEFGVDPESGLAKQRKCLRERAFYIKD